MTTQEFQGMLNQVLHLPLTSSISTRLKASPEESKELDRDFCRYFVARMLPVARPGLGVWLALVIAVCILDSALMPRAFFEQVIFQRVVTMLIPLSAALGATFLFKERSWLPYFLASTAFLACGAAVVMSATIAGSGFAGAGGLALAATLCVYLFLGLTLRQSMLVAWPIFGVYLAVCAMTAIAPQEAAYGILLLGFANIIGTLAGFLQEKNARQAFDDKRELFRLARTDGLTGLYSRRTFDQHLRKIWKQAERDEKQIAVVVADIDHFKLYNDCYGHRMGDACIRAVSDVVAASVNRPLDMVARYGGEEFVIVLFDASASFTEAFSRSLCQKVIDLNIDHKGSETTPIVSLSVGAAMADAAGNVKSDQLIRQADDALYEAKSRGRNQAVVYRTEWGQQTTANLASSLL